jgi:Amidase
VGKTKCTQLAPANNRQRTGWSISALGILGGDGYLSPRESSTGTAVAVAGYSWLDIGIGTDSTYYCSISTSILVGNLGIAGGSTRGPAAIMGLYAIRPTYGATSMEGVLPAAKSVFRAGRSY